MTGVIGTSCVAHNEPLSTTPEFMLIRLLAERFLDSFRTGAGHWTDQGNTKGVDLPAPPQTIRTGEWLEVKSITNGQ